MRSFTIALAFLTRLPLRLDPAASPDEIPRSANWFGAVGMIVGVSQGAALLGLATVFDATTAAVGASAFAVVLTGGFHHDGLGDSADALVGHHSRQRRLEILKDPSLGTYGVLALIFVVLFEVALLRSIPTGTAVVGLVVAHVTSRQWALLVARPVDALGAGLSSTLGAPSWRRYVLALGFWAVAVGSAIVWLTVQETLGPSAAGLRLVAGVLVAGGVAVAVRKFGLRQVGELRGDFLGAVERCSFIAFLSVWAT